MLIGKGPDGPAARTITPAEAAKLLHGRSSRYQEEDRRTACGDPKMLLDATPRKLADAAVHWAAQQLLGENLPDKVGVCRLAWEEETERVLMKWLQDNPKQGSAGLVGGKQKNKNKGLPLHEQAMKAMCYVLMHAAGTEECPISEEGWVKWQQLAAHQSCKRFQNWVLLEALDQDKKDRLVAKQDTDGVWWVAAWSGHTQERVVGPGSGPNRGTPGLAGAWQLPTSHCVHSEEGVGERRPRCPLPRPRGTRRAVAGRPRNTDRYRCQESR